MAERMRAAWYDRQGEPEDVLRVGMLDRPQPGAGEVLVKVYASGVNPSDTYGRRGTQAPMAFSRVVPHQDGAGVIEAVGAGVPPKRIGERVWVYEATLNRATGTAAEYTVVPSRRAVRLPDGIDFDAGACLGIPALTAHRAVFVDGGVRGQTVLVTGGAGAVGSAAVQLARWGGAATIIATVSSVEKARVATDAGADHVVNYRGTDVVVEIRRITAGVGNGGSGDASTSSPGVDRIVDVDFGGNLPTTLQIIKPNGVIASYATRGNPEPSVPFRALMQKNVAIRAILVYTMPEEAKTSGAADITRALEEGALRPIIGGRMKLDDIAQAHTAVERGTIIGNVVLHYA